MAIRWVQHLYNAASVSPLPANFTEMRAPPCPIGIIEATLIQDRVLRFNAIVKHRIPTPLLDLIHLLFHAILELGALTLLRFGRPNKGRRHRKEVTVLKLEILARRSPVMIHDIRSLKEVWIEVKDHAIVAFNPRLTPDLGNAPAAVPPAASASAH